MSAVNVAETPEPSATRDALSAALSRLDQAEWRDDPREAGLARLQAAACYRSMGGYEAAEALLRQVLLDARRVGAADLTVQALCAHAEVACARAESLVAADPGAVRSARERARDGAFEAALLALRAGTESWVAAALQRMARVLGNCGDHDDAAALQARALALGTPR